MGFVSSIMGSSKAPKYLEQFNRESALFKQDQMNANRDNWNDAKEYSQLGPESDIGYDTAVGSWLNSNPYIDQVVQNTTNQITDNYNKSYIPKAMSDFAGSGRFGSGLFQKTMADTQSQMNKDVANSANQTYYNNYNTERGFQEEARNRLGQQYDPLNRNSQYSSILNGGQSQSVDYANQQNREKPGLTGTISAAQQGLGSIMGLAGSLGTIFSDKRLKENTKKVGKLDNGLTVYKYNYKGEPTTQIGVMAQDVKKKKPEAVNTVGNWLTVNYDLATEK